MDLSWVSTDARTGRVLADLPGLSVSTIKRSICRYETAVPSLPLPTAPENWLSATRPGGTNLILLADGRPIYGAMVTQRPRSSGDEVQMSVATAESYLDRRYMGDVSYGPTDDSPSTPEVGQNDIVEDIIERFVIAGPRGGMPFRVVRATPGAGKLRTRSYTRSQRKTVYSALTELAAVEGGPEWTVEWEHQSNPERYAPVLYVGDRIGTAVRPGMRPNATFDMPGCLIEATLVEDYSAGKAANAVIAYSTATADVIPESPQQVAEDDGRPTFEVDFQPTSDITIIDTLTEHARSALASLALGGRALSMTAVMQAGAFMRDNRGVLVPGGSTRYASAPPLGTDWVLGDDLGYAIGGLEPDRRMHWVDVYDDLWPADDVWPLTDTWGTYVGRERVLVNPLGRDSVPAFPGGITGVDRCVGWEMTLDGVQTVTPILASTGD